MEGSRFSSMSFEERKALLDQVPDEILPLIQMSAAAPWQYIPSEKGYASDPDFGHVSIGDKKNVGRDRVALQRECWSKSVENPQINTAVRGLAGRLAGFGFDVSSDIYEIDEFIRNIVLDPRNRLYLFMFKYVIRSIIEGELFLALTIHPDGFVEIDFIDPKTITGGNEDGIIFHPRKTNFPLFYFVQYDSGQEMVPSTNIARYPYLVAEARKQKAFSDGLIKCKTSDRKYKSIGGYNRFIVNWDKSFITSRNVSHIRTAIKWANHYENLKLYEIDHKKSSGAYLWKVICEDFNVYRLWLAMSDDDREKTGIGGKKTPGSTLVLPKGMDIQAVNPNLPRISEGDTDILEMVSSGLNEPQDVTMGKSSSPFASVKASRGPMSDRVSDEISQFENFLRFDMWGSIFFLHSKMTSFSELFDKRIVVGFKEGKEKDEFGKPKKEPKWKTVKRKPEELMEISFPSSEIIDAESRARAYLGVKHGSTYDVLGIPNAEIAKRLGFGNYRKMRLFRAAEEETYPSLVQNIDQEMFQEKTEAEPPRPKRTLPKDDEDA